MVFFLGVFWKRMNAQGALWAMIVGFVVGVFRMLVDTPVTLGLAGFENGYTPGSFLWICNNIYFQYFSVLITIVSAIVMVGVSLATAEPDYARIQSLTFGTRPRPRTDRRPGRAGTGTTCSPRASCSAASSAPTCTSAAENKETLDAPAPPHLRPPAPHS